MMSQAHSGDEEGNELVISPSRSALVLRGLTEFFPSFGAVARGLACAIAVAVTAVGAANAAVVVVDPPQLLPTPGPGGWWLVEESPSSSGNATGALVSGPGTPPSRDGSVQMMLDAGPNGRMLLGTVDYNGTPLDDLTNLEYSTHRTSADPGGNLAIALQIQVDYDLTDAHTGFQGRIVFEPYFTAGSGNVGQNVWQTWDPTNGPVAKWWGSSISGPFAPHVGGVAVAQQCPQSAPCTWNQLKSFYPDAGIHVTLGAVLLKAGAPWPSFVGNADALTIGVNGSDTTYDFEACATRHVATTGSDAGNVCHDSGAPCATIQRAIDVACEGDTILVAPGTYPESPDVDKSVTLQSTGGAAVTTIDLQTGPTYLGSLQIGGDTVVVDGFTIEGRDVSCPTLAASNVTVTTTADDVTIRNNRIRVGANDPTYTCSNYDDGIGVLSYYDASPVSPITSLVVEDNEFEPLGASGFRAFYVNPGVGTFTFDDNTVTGKFDASSLTQAQSATVSDNSVDGQGLGGRGLATWGYPDAAVFGSATFSGNVITGVVNGITINESNDVVIQCNRLQGNTRGVYVVGDLGAGTLNFDPSTVGVQSNSLIGNATAGVENAATLAGTVDAEGNWWGCVAGPGNPGCDASLGDVDESPALNAVPACVNCTANAQCQDGLGCNGSEVCNLMTGVCGSGTPPDCSGQCFTGVCLDPSGACQALPFGATCDSGLDTCSETDECDGIDGSGVCLNTGGGGDVDVDQTCELDDNCPGLANTSQADIDSDGDGDMCDADDGGYSLVLGRARLRHAVGTSLGAWTVTGSLNVNDEQLAFATKAVANQILVNVRDGDASFDSTVALTGCTETRQRIRCTNATRTVRALFTPTRTAPFVYRFSISASKVPATETGATQPAGLVHASLHEGPPSNVDRHDTIGDIVACAPSGTRSLSCREK